MILRLIFILSGGFLFLVSLVGHFYVKIKLRPGFDSNLDDHYHEFEDSHPELARYEKWSHITLTGVVVSMLLMLDCVAFNFMFWVCILNELCILP